MRILRKICTSILILIFFFSLTVYAETTPIRVTLQARVSNKITGLYHGAIDVNFGFYPADLDTPVWNETIKGVRFVEGDFSVLLGTNPENQIDPEIFNQSGLRLGFRLQESEIKFIQIKAVPYAIQSYVAEYAVELFDNELLFLDRENQRVGIGTSNPSVELDVSGSVKADYFIGDGYNLTNLNIDTDKLVWTKLGNDIYYTSGNVGIGVTNPSYLLDVNGNAHISGNLTVVGTVQAANFQGNGQFLENIDAAKFTTGTVPSARLSGSYPLIVGVGTLTSGIWQASVIDDLYIANNLTLNGASFSGTNNISGSLRAIGDLTIGAVTQEVKLFANNWQITEVGNATFEYIQTSGMKFEGNTISARTPQGLNIYAGGSNRLTIEDGGNVGIGLSDPETALDINGGLKVGNTTSTLEGTIRWTGSDLEGYKGLPDAWVSLTYLGTFDGHSLNAADGIPEDAIYVDEEGKVAIGHFGSSPPNPEATLDVSGNVVFRGGGEPLTVAGPGTRFMWYPQKAAVRAGQIEGTQWDNSNIGFGSVAFGKNALADKSYSTISGGQDNSARGAYSTVGGGSHNKASGFSATILGGRFNTASGNYSVILGGGYNDSTGGNIASGNYSVVSGGSHNSADSNYAVVAGGQYNTAAGEYSFAAGRRAKSIHNGSFVWSDTTDSDFSTTAPNQFLIRASSGVGIGTNTPSEELEVVGTIKASSFIGDGSNLTNVNAGYLSGYPASETYSPTHQIYISTLSGYLPAGTIDTGSILNYTILTEDLAAGSVTSAKITDNAITTAKIAVGAVTNDKIAANAIDTGLITDYAVTNAKLADFAIASINIAPASITEDKIAINAITGDKILDGTITSVDIAAGAINASHIQAGSITSSAISENAIITEHITDGSVTNEKIAGILPVLKGGTGTSNFTAGSIIFAKEKTPTITLTEDNSNLYWDISNKRMGIKTNSPQYTLDVNGTIRADQVRTEGTDEAIRGIGGDIGVYGEGTIAGIYGVGGNIGVLGENSNDSLGVRGWVNNATAGARGVVGEISGAGGVSAFGALGWTDGTRYVSVYGGPASGGTYNWAGYFGADVYIGHLQGFSGSPTARLLVEGATTLSTEYALNVTNSNEDSILSVRNDGRVGIGTTAPEHTLHVNGSTHFTKTAGFKEYELIGSTSIEWSKSNKVKITITGSGDPIPISFSTDPPNATNLLLIIEHSTDREATLPTGPNFKYPGGVAPTLPQAADVTDIVSFYFDGSTYYGVSSTGFQ